MLIDAGGIPSFGRTRKPGLDIGEDVVSPYLWTRSIKRLDIVVMTHAHEDHMGGMSAVLRNFHPRELWTGATQDSPEWRSVRDTAQRLHIAIRHMQRGPPFPFGGTTMQILAPGPDYLPDAIPKNDDSLVMRVRFGATSFLLTGDMEKKIERELASLGLFEHDDVLKVGHHGSRTSSSPMLLDLEHPDVRDHLGRLRQQLRTPASPDPQGARRAQGQGLSHRRTRPDHNSQRRQSSANHNRHPINCSHARCRLRLVHRCHRLLPKPARLGRQKQSQRPTPDRRQLPVQSRRRDLRRRQNSR